MRTIANCLVTTGLVLVGALVARPLYAANLDAASQVDAVTVYPDGASVTRVITLDLPAGDNTLIAKDFPIGLDPSSLRVEGEGGAKLTIGAIDTKLPGPLLPQNLSEIDKRIEALNDQRADLQGLISAAEARRKFAERFAEASPAGLGEKGEARPLSEWRAAFSAVADEVATADSAIRDAERKIRVIDRDLAQLAADRTSKPPSKVEVRIDLASQAATKATLRVTYAVSNARWMPLYDARLDTGAKDRKPAIELVRRAEITQSTGEDWSNVALAVSTVRVARGGNAPDLNSLVVRYPQPPRPMATSQADRAMKSREALAPAPAAPADAIQEFRFGGGASFDIAAEREATAQAGAFQASFKIPGRVSVGANEGAKSLRIATATITPDLAVRAVPVIDPTAFLEASFVQADDAPLLPGQVSIYRDGIFVGRGRMTATAKDETVRLGFGADDKVKIERTVVKRNEGSAGLIVTTSKTDERAFKTTVRNGHDFPIKVAIQDQLPVSEHDDIVVEMLPSSTPATTTNLRDKRGVLEWAFEAKPTEVRDINFAWRMRWPKDKGVVMVPAG
ncbi:mucoidy inhibitor MuiA family protein [Bradyrhizobium sp. USDA 3364]